MTAATGGGAPSVTFATTLTAFGNNTGIVVPAELVERLGSTKRPPVEVDLGGHRYRTTIGVMKGQQLVSVSAAVRKETGLAAGDPVTVTLTLAEGPREVAMPDDFAAALDAEPAARAFFDTRPNSLQRYHVDNVERAKAADTRARRIDKAVSLFLAGEKR